MKRSPWLCLVAVAVAFSVSVAACSSSDDSSGVTETKKLNQLSSGERDMLCAFSVSVEHAPRTVDCGNMISIMLKDKASCVTSFTAITLQCEATVGDAEACFRAIGADPCSFGVGTCTALFTCVLPTAL